MIDRSGGHRAGPAQGDPAPRPPPFRRVRRRPAITPPAPGPDTRTPGVPSTGSDARQARAGSADGVWMAARSYVACAATWRAGLAYQRVKVCPERLAIEPRSAPPAAELHAPRSPFRREATIAARAAHRTWAVVFAPDAPPASPCSAASRSSQRVTLHPRRPRSGRGSVFSVGRP